MRNKDFEKGHDIRLCNLTLGNFTFCYQNLGVKKVLFHNFNNNLTPKPFENKCLSGLCSLI